MLHKPTDSKSHPLRNLPLPNTTKADEVISYLEKHVDEAGINVGDLLPHEAEIVTATGLSRTCVREAMMRLRALGIVESRRHAGTRLVRPLFAHNFMRVLASRELPQEAFGHVGGLRSAIELGFSKEIFSRVNKADIEYLRKICSNMQEDATSREQFTFCEKKFHSKLIEITENALAISLWQMLEPFFRKISPIRAPIPESIIAKHSRIVDALEARDENAFRKEMHIHHDQKLAWDGSRYDKEFLDPQFLEKPLK